MALNPSNSGNLEHLALKGLTKALISGAASIRLEIVLAVHGGHPGDV